MISSKTHLDLSDNKNDAEIVNCEIIEQEISEYKEIKIPYRRESTFKLLSHKENGFFNNKWRNRCTRWNQLRYINEVLKNDELIYNDGLSNLEFIEYGRIFENNITEINVGL